MDKMRKQLEEDFSFMSYAPILFISAKTGQRLDKLFETIQYVDVQNGTRIPTGALNEMLARSTARVQPPSDKGKRLKIFYITQSSARQHSLRSSTRKRCSIFLTSAISKTRFGKTLA